MLARKQTGYLSCGHLIGTTILHLGHQAGPRCRGTMPLIRHTCTKYPKAGEVYDQRPSMPIGLPGRRPVSCAERSSALSGVSVSLTGKSRLGLPVSHSVNTRTSPYREEPE